jgi:uncharacterized protein (TIGR00255 family)
MVKSMTGFGRAETRFGNGKVVVEAKTVNHKFLDLSLKLAESVMPFEEKIKDILQKSIKRGKVNLNISYDGTIAKSVKVDINDKVAKEYHASLTAMRKKLGLKDEVSLKDIITLPGVINYTITEKEFVKLWPKVKEALDEAVRRLVKEREKEGKALYADLAMRAKAIDKMVSVIKASTHVNIEEYRKKFSDKIKDLTNGRDVDMGRLETEVAIYAKNSDISEEITRLKNHLVNFKSTLSEPGETGKKLDFIAQELHREINTIGSKASDFRIAKNVIEIKSEIEKIREQVKNLE